MLAEAMHKNIYYDGFDVVNRSENFLNVLNSDLDFWP